MSSSVVQPKPDQRPPKRSRAESIDEPIKSLEQTIFRLGDKHPTMTVEEDILKCVEEILKEKGTTEDALIASAIADCIIDLPHKSTVYASLLRELMNNENENSLVKQIFDNLNEKVQVAAKQGPWRHFSQGSRFYAIAAQTGVISLSSVEIFYQSLLKIYLTDPNESNDFCLWILFALLPLLRIPLNEDLKTLYHSRSQSKKNIPSDLIFLWNILNSAMPAEPLSSVPNSLEIDLKINSDLISSFGWDSEYEYFNIFSDAFQPTSTSYDQWTVNYYYRHLIESLEFNHRACADILLNGVTEGSLIASAEKTLVQFLFGEVLRNRVNGYTNMVYESLLVDCCRLSRSFPPAMAKALNILFEERLDSLGFVATDRLASWFALHLSNFDMKWKWTSWVDVLNAPPTSMKIVFVRLTLEKLLSLSFREKLTSALPNEFHQLLPSSPEPHAKYSNSIDDEDADAKLVQKLADSIKNRSSPQEIKESLNYTEGSPLPVVEREILLEALLLVGSKSLSHMLGVIEKYLPLFQLLVPKEERARASMMILSQISSFWRNSRIHFEFIVERLIHYRILVPVCVLGWISERSEYMVGDIDCSFIDLLWGPLSRSLIMRTLCQAFSAPKYAELKLAGQPEEKINSILTNLRTEAGDCLKFILEKLACLRDHVASATSKDISIVIEKVATDYVGELISIYPNEVRAVSVEVMTTCGSRASISIVELLEQATF